MRTVERIVSTVVVAVGIAWFAGACSSTGANAAGAGAGAPGPTASGSGAAAVAPATSSAASARASAPSGPAASPSGTTHTSAANYPVDLQPQTAAAGSHVMVYGLTCSATTGTASSDAFVAPVALSMISNATGGSATVKPGTAPGRYTVKVTCGDITATGTLTVS